MHQGVALAFAGRALPLRLRGADPAGTSSPTARPRCSTTCTRRSTRRASRCCSRPRRRSTTPRRRTVGQRSAATAQEQRIECDYIVGCDGFHGRQPAAVPEGVSDATRRLSVRVAGHLVRDPAGRARADLLPTASAASRCAPCATRCSAATTCSARSTTPSTSGATTASGTSCFARLPTRSRRAWSPARRSRSRSRRCGASSPNRCATAACSWPATPPTSCRRPGPRASTWPCRTSIYLARALVHHYDGDDTYLDGYSDMALRRVWEAVRFSWWMTTLLHRFPETGDLRAARCRHAELDYLVRVGRGPDGLGRELRGSAGVTARRHRTCRSG